MVGFDNGYTLKFSLRIIMETCRNMNIECKVAEIIVHCGRVANK